jgi:hypothetical protein
VSGRGRRGAGPKNRVAEEVGRLYRAEGPDLPPPLSSLWEATGNPFWVWEQIAVCGYTGSDFPDWVRTYLVQCAERMTSPDAPRARDLRKALPGILGFPKNNRGAGHLLNPGGMHDVHEYADLALKFVREIKLGRKPTAALANARADGDPEVDDRTLLRRIKKILGVTGNPHTKAEWSAALRHWF